jgi:calcium/calmodulin-dependent protein kinase I
VSFITLCCANETYSLVYPISDSDLKPENLLMTSQSDDADIKVVDFGFAVECEDNSITNQCGTPGYMAPEIILHRNYGKLLRFSPF